MSNQRNVGDLHVNQAAASSQEASAQSGQLLELNNVQLLQYFSTFVLIFDCCSKV